MYFKVVIGCWPQKSFLATVDIAVLRKTQEKIRIIKAIGGEWNSTVMVSSWRTGLKSAAYITYLTGESDTRASRTPQYTYKIA
jgi:hypothetical protein